MRYILLAVDVGTEVVCWDRGSGSKNVEDAFQSGLTAWPQVTILRVYDDKLKVVFSKKE